MNKIQAEELEALLSTTDFNTFFPEDALRETDEVLAHPIYGKDLKIFHLLNYPSEDLMSRYSEQQLFYSKYYYFLRYTEKHKLLHGLLSDIEQQMFKVMEQGDYVPDVDWDYVEELHNEVLAELGLSDQPQ